MSWIVVISLALAAFLALAFVFKAPRQGWEAIGAALLLGIAGFAFQAHPGQPGSPKAPQESAAKGGETLIAARKALAGDSMADSNSWMVIGDALARNGQYGDAAGVLLGAIHKDPKNAEAWVALGNALIGHAEGTISPAALYAYQKGAEADPSHPGPRFFLGLALAQNGRLQDGRRLWAELLAQSPKDAPWRADLEARLARLDAFIAAQQDNGRAQ